jgi:hypothetical protein
VTWKDASEVKQAVEVLLPMWTEVGTADALELLGPSTSDYRVRSFAVRQLKRADDDVSGLNSMVASGSIDNWSLNRNYCCTCYS